MDQFTGLAILAIFPLCMVFATFYDLFTMTIPNKISLALIIGFFILAPLAGMGWQTMLFNVAIAAGVLLVGFCLFNFGVMGGGDAKLIAASSLWFGLSFTVHYVAIASVIGGALTVLIIIARNQVLPATLLRFEWIVRLHDKKEGVPYGAALGPAALYVFANSPWMNFVIFGTNVG